MKIDGNLIAIATLVAMVIAVIGIIVPLINSYRNVVQDAMNNIKEIERNLLARVALLEKGNIELSRDLKYMSLKVTVLELNSQSTQAWNESKLITHLKKDFEIIDAMLRDNNNIEECKSIIGYKRYKMAGVICSIIIDGDDIDNEDVENAADARRTVNRIMEIIKSHKELTDKLNEIGFLEDCKQLEIAVENLFTNIERGETKRRIPNLDQIKSIAER